MNSHSFSYSMKRCICLFAALVSLFTISGLTLASEATTPGQGSKDEETLWNLERAYWRYVQDSDLPAYSNLWHEDFLG